MKNQLGISYEIFEYHGQRKEKILEFRAAPGNIKIGIKVMREKLGITEKELQERPEIRKPNILQTHNNIPDLETIKAHVKQHAKNIIEGKMNRR
jgi:hypothetical protein